MSGEIRVSGSQTGGREPVRVQPGGLSWVFPPSLYKDHDSATLSTPPWPRLPTPLIRPPASNSGTNRIKDAAYARPKRGTTQDEARVEEDYIHKWVDMLVRFGFSPIRLIGPPKGP
eukprot:scaffold291160_cov22-Prasinocladus_malaysianus.AAC.1